MFPVSLVDRRGHAKLRSFSHVSGLMSHFVLSILINLQKLRTVEEF